MLINSQRTIKQIDAFADTVKSVRRRTKKTQTNRLQFHPPEKHARKAQIISSHQAQLQQPRTSWAPPPQPRSATSPPSSAYFNRSSSLHARPQYGFTVSMGVRFNKDHSEINYFFVRGEMIDCPSAPQRLQKHKRSTALSISRPSSSRTI